MDPSARCYDLHSHSLASDGALAPADLVDRAADYGVTHLALTDHDTLAGLEGLSAEDRAALMPHFEADIRDTGILIGRDHGHWLAQ